MRSPPISHPQCGSRRRFASSACHATAATHVFPVAAQCGEPSPAAWSLSRTLSPSSSISRVTNRYRLFRGGDTSPRVELPRPATGGAISPTPPDTRRPALPRAPRFRRVHAHAIPASHLPVNALRPRSRPVYRTACVTSRHHRRCSSVRSPAGVTRRRHGGRPATRHPHCAGLLRCRLPRPPPLSKPQCGSPNGCHAHGHGLALAALLRSHTGRPRLAARAFREDKTQRPCGSRRRPVRSPPLLCRSGIFVGQRTGPLPRRLLACRCARRRFHVPSVAAAARV